MIIRNGSGRSFGTHRRRSFGDPTDDTLTNEQLVDKYVGATLSSIPDDVQGRIISHNAALAGPPPKDGFLGYMLLPNTLANGSYWAPPDILVRREQAERAHDLGWAYLPSFSWASPDAKMRKVIVNGQKAYALEKFVKANILPIAGTVLGAVGLGAAAALLPKSKKSSPGAGPSPIDMQRAAEQRAAQIRKGPGAGAAGAVGVVGGAGAGFLVGGPVGAVAGAAAGYFLGKKVGQAGK